MGLNATAKKEGFPPLSSYFINRQKLNGTKTLNKEVHCNCSWPKKARAISYYKEQNKPIKRLHTNSKLLKHSLVFVLCLVGLVLLLLYTFIMEDSTEFTLTHSNKTLEEGPWRDRCSKVYQEFSTNYSYGAWWKSESREWCETLCRPVWCLVS